MSKLYNLYTKSRVGLSPYERTPETALIAMARQCGRDEIATIHIRLKMLKAELKMNPEWDGDTNDQIWDAINEHRNLLKLISVNEPYLKRLLSRSTW
ncbi:hypothetical protein D8682_06170 [Buttiauxella sp. 3AFRM03]|jgi:hypothetical protein|nr:hypothetical protein D8682_06170 [Buttiauxella sp. 3AFRM03]MCE0826839.1 hypothetical protein [Buttiauxella ferragutiae]